MLALYSLPCSSNSSHETRDTTRIFLPSFSSSLAASTARPSSVPACTAKHSCQSTAIVRGQLFSDHSHCQHREIFLCCSSRMSLSTEKVCKSVCIARQAPRICTCSSCTLMTRQPVFKSNVSDKHACRLASTHNSNLCGRYRRICHCVKFVCVKI